ncbi:hypothetical protein N7532_008498 [Penicillium argentinense]|uniref:Alcohol dehydrogenase-like N-terminal domain-containing protein n=1 Tax=Penicillium argentinense TaxID=1131581 RepID=A0A9W9EXQ5_9EURO|nr:uncharacterized protein N7532_008498 [Penicillium argentinense]KAJ5089814.1 hypothetical protein N7532_008498 [Penicillium argentinense]
MVTHLAAVSLAKGEPFELQTRPTPKPGPGELLIEVKSISLNPADGIMRDQGLFIPAYPTVIGFDIAGLVLEAGDNVPIHPTNGGGGQGPCFQPSVTRVAAYAAAVWKSCDLDYGAFPGAVSCLLAALLASSRRYLLTKEEAPLIWGASSSVGTMGVQSARLLRDDQGSSFVAVYATTRAANQKYIASLGADRVFDYKDPQVIDAIVSAARENGLVIRHCFLTTGQLASCQAVLKAFVGDGHGGEELEAKIGLAPPSMEEEEWLGQFQYWLGSWPLEKLANGIIRPNPEPKAVGKGPGAINDGLDELTRGVSCSKLVVEVAE